VREKIKEKWGYPCIRSGQSCEYKEATLDVEFGVLQDGRLKFVDVVRRSDYQLYDEYAVNAVWRASPFPAVPPEMTDAMNDKTLKIRARFAYFFQKDKR
jgi:TonB family protein